MRPDTPQMQAQLPDAAMSAEPLYPSKESSRLALELVPKFMQLLAHFKFSPERVTPANPPERSSENDDRSLRSQDAERAVYEALIRISGRYLRSSTAAFSSREKREREVAENLKIKVGALLAILEAERLVIDWIMKLQPGDTFPIYASNTDPRTLESLLRETRRRCVMIAEKSPKKGPIKRLNHLSLVENCILLWKKLSGKKFRRNFEVAEGGFVNKECIFILKFIQMFDSKTTVGNASSALKALPPKSRKSALFDLLSSE